MTHNEQRISVLLSEYCLRKKRNPSYSLRAFARDCNLSPGAFSQILNHKRPLTRKTCIRIANHLPLSPQKRQILIEETGAKAETQNGRKTSNAFRYLEDSKLNLISEWYYYAVLNLIDTEDCKIEPEWIAKRLGVSNLEVQTALTQLKDLKLIKICDGRYVRIQRRLKTQNDIPSATIKRAHISRIKLAEAALMNQSVAKREFSAITIAMDPLLIPDVKKKIRKLLDELMIKYPHIGTRKEVFQLNVQFFQLSK